ncbi:hypothetical protein E3Z27_26320 [Pseudomonas mediterranea]|uniref:Lipoprotein n=1 Tax=Pseudomonas mediterranea TaxID=183795 RepID=A0AAX2D7H0_9PSED|nr:hypothetical protein [Pseudomonas mediterranea]KGU83645.1 lipoprotein [Pseudomonas mediterranea CFBP 5447]MBL0842535.1 hypothetical protein [Pseudomonas mediterranea]MDU9029068.1 hypothetical protein [Pseudomonas mediterranea]QHA84917.1 hypothetical protein E3Z27_26320 [Pseudomonas mediterranea]UZE00649.1 hypothetical protein LOY71_24655 [Pseudomonas mediterranea]
MVKTWTLLLLTGALAACGSHPPATPEPATGDPEPGCYQADWQAETNPVLNKRSGPDGLDKYETQTPTKEHGCP